jgi:hypothetical protein
MMRDPLIEVIAIELERQEVTFSPRSEGDVDLPIDGTIDLAELAKAIRAAIAQTEGGQ